MNFYLLIPLFLILILFIPIKIEGRASFNFLDFTGAVGAFIYKFQIEHQRFKVKKRELIPLNDLGEEDEGFSFSETELIFTKMIIGEIKDKTRLTELFIIYNLGLGDAFATAMLAGQINALLLTLLVSIKNYKPTASLGVCDTISYNREVAQFAVKMKITISLFDIVYSLVRSVILTRKETNKKEVAK